MKRFYKIFASWFLCLFLVLSQFIVSLADVRSLMIGSDSNALMTMELDDSDYAVMPMSSAGTVVNTVSDSNIRVQCVYVDADGNPSSYFLKPEFENNRFSISCPQLPENCFYTQFVFVIMPGSIPPVGGYLMGFDFGSHFSFDYSSVSLNTYKKINNANTISKSTSIPFNQISGDMYFDGFEIDLTSVTQMNLNLFTNETTLRNFSGDFAWSFVRSNVSDNAFVSAGSDTSVQDYQSGVSSSLSDLSSSVGDLDDSIGEVEAGIDEVTSAIQNLQGAMEPHYSNVLTQLHHITEQLHAFYDQVYNNIHLPELDMLTQIKTAIENIDLQIEVDISEVKTAINNMSMAVQNKLQSVSDTIIGGYDNSGLESDKLDLDSVLSDYEKAEEDLFEDAKGNINDFEFDTPLDEFTGPLSDVSYFLSGMFTALGPMNVVITFSLTLTIAMVMIGWYRFKGGR